MDLDLLRDTFPDLEDIDTLQEGGQKQVFRCWHPDFGACVLKLLHPRSQDRLEREVEAVRRLMEIASNNVPKVHRVGTVTFSTGQFIWLLEQYVDGEELSSRLRQGPLEKGQILALSQDLVSGAAGAESVQVVHRDIKPKNIKIDSEGEAWLLDFGIARILDLESLTRTDEIIGPHTPGYGAPEQVRYEKQKIDGRTDLFAIGVVLYESATGSNPFLEGASNKIEVLRRVENMPLPRPELNWDTDGLFADFIVTNAQKQPYQRPASCAEALDWLHDIIDQLGGL